MEICPSCICGHLWSEKIKTWSVLLTLHLFQFSVFCSIYLSNVFIYFLYCIIVLPLTSCCDVLQVYDRLFEDTLTTTCQTVEAGKPLTDTEFRFPPIGVTKAFSPIWWTRLVKDMWDIFSSIQYAWLLFGHYSDFRKTQMTSLRWSALTWLLHWSRTGSWLQLEL